ncbi:hypothetical protein [Pseudodesulfovibrio sp.]|uniref:hypothetical protein n=1 Tax=Pseudodesulfovibrio sp. TaxID=2035812 RepID=UPI0026320097|nr:hypothetical protein [Pseudodesulfovibrio sp.]MDD3310939.1 hypothetical protein [Pseudodesulfovibrio sp.]
MQYRFPDNNIATAKTVASGGHTYPAGYLAWRASETEGDWISRLAAIGVAPVRHEQPAGYDAATQTKGDPVGALDEAGWWAVTWPDVADRPDAVEIVRAAKLAEIRDAADAYLAAAGAEYGAMERATWDQQYDEAMAYQAGTGASVPLLTAIATARGMDVSELADRIISNRAAWVALSGAVVGQRLAYQDALDAAQTVADIRAIGVSYA